MNRFCDPAIVLGGGATTGLEAVRSLGRAGIPVYYLDDEECITVFSKYCKNYFVSSKIKSSKEELKEVLLNIQNKTDGVVVLFPASDLFALYLSDLMDELSNFRVPAPTKQIIEILIDKKKFYQTLSEERIPFPATHFPQDLESVKEISKEVSYPVFLKPRFSHLFRQHFGSGKKGFLVNSPTELAEYCEMLMKVGVEVMVQDVILGPPTDGVFIDGYMDAASTSRVLFARHRLRMWPLDFGNSSLCEAIPISMVASLKEPLLKYLKSIHYRGIFSAEYKKDERDGLFKIVEINSRTSGWFSTLSAKCGVSIMLAAYLDAIGRGSEYSENYPSGAKLMFTVDDIRASLAMLMKRELSVGQWISSLLGETEHVPYARDDILPFIKDISNLLQSIFRA